MYNAVVLLAFTEEAASAYDEAKEAYDAEVRRIGKLIRRAAAAQTVNGVKRPTALRNAEKLYAPSLEGAKIAFKRKVRGILAEAFGIAKSLDSDRPQS